jgi:hypothetical protein
MSKRSEVERIIDAAGTDEAICVVEPDGEGGYRKLAERLMDNPTQARIVVLGMEPSPNSVAHLADRGLSRPSQAEAPAEPGDTPTDPKPLRGPAQS